MNSRIKKAQQNFDLVVKLEQDFSNLANVPFKIIEVCRKISFFKYYFFNI